MATEKPESKRKGGGVPRALRSSQYGWTPTQITWLRLGRAKAAAHALKLY